MSAQALNLFVREGWLAQHLSQQGEQHIQVFDQCVAAEADGVCAATDAHISPGRFEDIVDLLESVRSRAALQGQGSKIGQAKLFVRIEERASFQQTADHHGWAVEVGAAEGDDAVVELDAVNVFRAR